jgi:hypothetical protein
MQPCDGSFLHEHGYDDGDWPWSQGQMLNVRSSSFAVG